MAAGAVHRLAAGLLAVVMLAAVLSACGGDSPDGALDAGIGPTMGRELQAGERVSLQSGLSFTVPAAFSLARWKQGASGTDDPPEIAGVRRLDGLVIGFYTLGKGQDWHNYTGFGAGASAGSSSDHRVEIRYCRDPGALMLAVITRLPHRPVGVVQFGPLLEAAALTTDEQARSLAQQVWEQLNVEGAQLPEAK